MTRFEIFALLWLAVVAALVIGFAYFRGVLYDLSDPRKAR